MSSAVGSGDSSTGQTGFFNALNFLSVLIYICMYIHEYVTKVQINVALLIRAEGDVFMSTPLMYDQARALGFGKSMPSQLHLV